MTHIVVNPTSFGSVLCVDHNRFYINKKETEKLRKFRKGAIKEIATTMYPQNIDGFINTLSKEMKDKEEDFLLLDKLCKERGWKLFTFAPLQMSVELTNTCPAKCPWCYKNASNIEKHIEVSQEVIYNMKDFAALYGSRMGYSGGEPTLNRKLFDYLSYRKEEVFDVLITTLIPNIDLKKLIRTEVDLVQVSLHGPPDIHDKIVGRPNATNKIIEKMLKLGNEVKIATNTVITEKTLEKLPELVSMLDTLKEEVDYNYTYTRIVLALPSGRGEKFIKIHKDLAFKFKNMVNQIEETHPNLNLELPSEYRNPLLYLEENNKLICPAATAECEVNLDGRIRPCNHYEEKYSSNSSLVEKEFRDIWLFDPFLSDFREGHPLRKCKNCEKKDYCISGCRFLANKFYTKCSNQI